VMLACLLTFVVWRKLGEPHPSEKYVMAFVREVQEDQEEPLVMTKIRRSVCQAAYAEFGAMTPCKSNRKILDKFMRTWMLKHGLRPSHILTHVPVCIELYFITDLQAQITAKKVREAVCSIRTRNGLFDSAQ